MKLTLIFLLCGSILLAQEEAEALLDYRGFDSNGLMWTYSRQSNARTDVYVGWGNMVTGRTKLASGVFIPVVFQPRRELTELIIKLADASNLDYNNTEDAISTNGVVVDLIVVQGKDRPTKRFKFIFRADRDKSDLVYDAVVSFDRSLAVEINTRVEQPATRGK